MNSILKIRSGVIYIQSIKISEQRSNFVLVGFLPNDAKSKLSFSLASMVNGSVYVMFYFYQKVINGSIVFQGHNFRAVCMGALPLLSSVLHSALTGASMLILSWPQYVFLLLFGLLLLCDTKYFCEILYSMQTVLLNFLIAHSLVLMQ